MGVNIRWVPYGRPAAEELRSAVSQAKGDEPLTLVSVVVPSNYVGVATRRLLASGTLGPVCGRGSGLAAVSFVTVYRMAELLGSARLAGSGRRPVSTPVIAAALRTALTWEPGIFAPVAHHAATETALVSAYREIRDLSDGALDALAETSGRARDVVRLHRAARTALEKEFYDEEDLLMSAAESLKTDEGTADRLGSVIVYLPERLSRHAGRFLGAVAASNELMVLAGSTGNASADFEVERSVRRIHGETGATPADAADLLAVVDRQRTQIITASDCDEEVRSAVRAIVDAARDGTPLDRMAILHASPEPYARLAHEQLAGAGLGLNGAAVTPLTARVAGRTLLGLLALPDGGYRREDVFAWLAGARLRHNGREIPVTSWERLSRDAGVVAGRADWDRRLATFAAKRDGDAELEEGDPDALPWRVESLRNEATRARALREFVVTLIDDLALASERPEPWSERADWARRQLLELIGGERRRTAWPVPEQKAAERVERALDRVSTLDAVEASVDLAVFTRTLELELESDLGRVGRMGEGVLVGPIGMGVGLDLDLVVVLGLAEGLFPSRTHDDTLLPDDERDLTGGELPLRSEQVERQHRHLLAALAGAAHHVLCVPRGDLRRNIERVPSRWILQIASALAGERWWSDELLTAERDWLTHVASFDAGIRHLRSPATEQEYRLRALMARGSSRLSVEVLATAGDPLLAAGAEVVVSRRSDRFTRFDGNLAGLHPPSPAERVASATRLEGWAACPFAYLLGSILRIQEVENPEDELQITPLEKGSLVHEVLERFIKDALDRPPPAHPRPGEPWTAADLARLMTTAEAVCDDYEARGLTGRPIFWRQDKKRILVDLLTFLDADSAYRIAHGTRPIEAELAFGFPKDRLGAVALELPDGRQVQFRGKADRVDVADDGTLHVVDYKTGKAASYKDLSEDNPDAQGRRLQLPVYGEAARQSQGAPDATVRAEYWFVSTGGKFERVGYSVTPEVLEHVGATLSAVVAGIEAGVFPHHPTAASTSLWVECPFCDPDGMGVAELRRQYERKRADPAMDVFVNLVDPVLEDPADAVLEGIPDA